MKFSDIKKKVKKWIGKEKNLSKQEISPEEQAKKDLRKIKKERYIAAIMERTGWDYDYAKQQMQEAKKNIGCSYYVYTYYELYNMTEEEQKAAQARWVKKKENQKVAEKKAREKTITETMAATGWDQATAESHLDEVMERTGCDAKEYLLYHFYELSEKEQESFMFLSHTDVIRAKFNTDVNLARLIADKSASNIHFAKYIDRKWCYNRDVSFEDFHETFKDCSKLFYKPLTSFGGHGACPYDIDESSMEDVYNELMGLAEGVIEEFVVQHPDLGAMSPRILNTVRLTSISYSEPVDEEGNCFVIPYAMLKMGGASGYVDNLREGGVGAAIDLETGELCTDGVDVALGVHTHHPVTGMKIKGFKVPFFAEAKEMVQRIVEENNMKGYLAWDVAITERGPMLIEINGRPSPTLLELPFYNTPERGRKHIMEKYM